MHDLVFGYTTYGDRRTSLQRNHLWNADVHILLIRFLEKCYSCIAPILLPSTREIISSWSQSEPNNVVSIDHFLLDDLGLFHVMDAKS